MEFSFVPSKLLQAKADIQRMHNELLSQDSLKEVPENELRRLIQELVSLEQNRIRLRSCSLLDEEICLIAYYIPHNFYHVDMKNLYTIFQLRCDNNNARILYEQWQNQYNDKVVNEFLIFLSKMNKNFQSYIQTCHMTDDDFVEFVENESPALGIYSLITRQQFEKGTALEEKCRYFGIREDSDLYKECKDLYYIFCSADDYMVLDAKELFESVKNYNTSYLIMFLENFLRELTLDQLQRFVDISAYMMAKVGTIQKPVNNQILDSLDEELRVKYTDWLNIWMFYKYFGNDRRSQFWKNFRYRSVTVYPSCNVVLMEMDTCYAIEFLIPNINGPMGPAYIYDKECFDQKYRHHLRHPKNKAGLKNALYHSNENKGDYKLRQVHTAHEGKWEKEIEKFLLEGNYTRRIDF